MTFFSCNWYLRSFYFLYLLLVKLEKWRSAIEKTCGLALFALALIIGLAVYAFSFSLLTRAHTFMPHTYTFQLRSFYLLSLFLSLLSFVHG